MAWSTKTSATQLTTISDSEQFFDQTPQLNPRELAHCEVEADFAATPTDHMRVNVYGTLDDSAENWDDTPIMSFLINKDTDPNKVSFIVAGVYKFRISVASTGTTDDHTSADFSFRKDGVSA